MGFYGIGAILAMLAGVFTFIVAFSTFEASKWNREVFSRPFMGRAKRIGISVKVGTSGIALIGTLGLLFDCDLVIFLSLIEVYPGIFSIWVLESLWEGLGLRPPARVWEGASVEAGSWRFSLNVMIFTYLTTLVQGAVLSFTMILFGTLSLGFISHDGEEQAWNKLE